MAQLPVLRRSGATASHRILPQVGVSPNSSFDSNYFLDDKKRRSTQSRLLNTNDKGDPSWLIKSRRKLPALNQ